MGEAWPQPRRATQTQVSRLVILAFLAIPLPLSVDWHGFPVDLCALVLSCGGLSPTSSSAMAPAGPGL